jgi:hypothetical protein
MLSYTIDHDKEPVSKGQNQLSNLVFARECTEGQAQEHSVYARGCSFSRRSSNERNAQYAPPAPPLFVWKLEKFARDT